MSTNADVVILGSGYRGIWLASEIVKLGWSVSWFQIHPPTPVRKNNDFIFDDWPWQVGPQVHKSHFVNAAKEFITDVLKPGEQDLSIQVITPNGPLELSGPGRDAALQKFFPKTHSELLNFFEAIRQSTRVEKGQKILRSQTNRFFERPLGERWCLEWLGGLRRSRSLNTQEWVKNWEGDLFDPASHFWLLNDSLEDVVERALVWAEKKGVTVNRNASLTDIGVEGRRVTGVEIKGGGFLNCKRLIVACSYNAAVKGVPKLAKDIHPQVKADTEVYVWARCGFYLKPGSRPKGLCEFSSFVIDPYMPLLGDNVGLMKWRVGEKGDSLTVWCRIPFAELKRRSYLMNLTELLEKHLGELFPWFTKRLVAVFPFEEYFHSPGDVRDDLAVVYDKKNNFKPHDSHLKNVTMMSPGLDRGLELLSQLASEYRLLNQLAEIRKKELKRDRALHPPRDGENLVKP